MRQEGSQPQATDHPAPGWRPPRIPVLLGIIEPILAWHLWPLVAVAWSLTRPWSPVCVAPLHPRCSLAREDGARRVRGCWGRPVLVEGVEGLPRTSPHTPPRGVSLDLGWRPETQSPLLFLPAGDSWLLLLLRAAYRRSPLSLPWPGAWASRAYLHPVTDQSPLPRPRVPVNAPTSQEAQCHCHTPPAQSRLSLESLLPQKRSVTLEGDCQLRSRGLPCGSW